MSRKEYQRQWREANKETSNAYGRDWYRKNRQKVLKKRLQDRQNNTASAEIQRKANRTYYKNNADARRKAAKRMQAAKRYRYWCIKKLCRCEVCGLTDTECLDFHHIDPNQKSFGVGHKCGTVSKEALLAEIMKCRVLCGCCHRAEHAKQRDIVSENILSVEEREEVMREAKEVFDFLSRQ